MTLLIDYTVPIHRGKNIKCTKKTNEVSCDIYFEAVLLSHYFSQTEDSQVFFKLQKETATSFL